MAQKKLDQISNYEEKSNGSSLSSSNITGSNMETGLQLGSLLLQVGSQMMDLTWSNKDPSNKAVSIFETVIRKK